MKFLLQFDLTATRYFAWYDLVSVGNMKWILVKHILFLKVKVYNFFNEEHGFRSKNHAFGRYIGFEKTFSVFVINNQMQSWSVACIFIHKKVKMAEIKQNNTYCHSYSQLV